MTLSNPAQYISGRTVQEQMNSLIDYVDQRAAEVATDAIAADVAQVHSDAADAHTDALAAAASSAPAAGTLANAVKKTGEASQSIAGDIAVAGALSGGSVSSSGNVDGASIGSGATPVTAGDLTAYGNVSLDDTVLQGNLSVADPSALINLGGAGSVLVPAPTGNSEAATKKYVDDALDNYAPMVRTTGNQSIAGVKQFTSNVQFPSIFDNKVSQNIENSSTWRCIYKNSILNPSNQMLLLAVTPQKPALMSNEYGILMVGGTNTTPVAKWFMKGTSINTSNFIVVTTVAGYLEVWVKNASGNAGLSFIKLHETNWGSVANNWTADPSTTDTSFDPTDTTKYSAYVVSS